VPGVRADGLRAARVSSIAAPPDNQRARARLILLRPCRSLLTGALPGPWSLTAGMASPTGTERLWAGRSETAFSSPLYAHLNICACVTTNGILAKAGCDELSAGAGELYAMGPRGWRAQWNASVVMLGGVTTGAPRLRRNGRWAPPRWRDSYVWGHVNFFPTQRQLAYLDAYRRILASRQRPTLARLGAFLKVTRQTIWQIEQNPLFRGWLLTELRLWREARIWRNVSGGLTSIATNLEP
jgi:hypothetical protein